MPASEGRNSMSERNNRARSSGKSAPQSDDHGDHLTMDHFPTRDEVARAVAAKPGHEPHEHGPHPMFDHFPTRDELRDAEAHFGIEHMPDLETAWLRVERHLNETGLELRKSDLLTQLTPKFSDALIGDRLQLKPWIIALLRALFRSRADHRTLSAAQRQQFNDAIQQVHADGSYQALAAVHADMSHNMHSNMGAVGKQRFLPWHRVYLLKMEDLLRSKKPGLTIPYWNYAEDKARPDWVWRPPSVTRPAPGASGSLPTTAVVNAILTRTNYTSFTDDLEFDAHNDVHNWCGGTLRSPPTASQDPIFWLLHANVDRIWDLWQLNHGGTPSLVGTDAIMDPWTQTASDANDVIKLGYSYK
jgi:hypothetical protein